MCKRKEVDGVGVENKVMRFETDIKLSPSVSKINEQFSLVDILLCYHGENRNRSYIAKDTIESALYSLSGIPIVGEFIYLDDGSKDFGSHGGKIVMTNDEIKFEDTTVPYGFIPQSSVDNAKWIDIVEKDGHTHHEYLELKECVIWNGRYQEATKIIEEDYGQSMEITINKAHYDEEGLYIIDDFIFSAACILGSHIDGTPVEPCFESSTIGRHYELDSFKREYQLMLDEYKKYLLNEKPEVKEDNLMDFEKVKEYLSAFKFKDTDTDRYMLIGDLTENQFTVLDKEDMKAYSVECALDDDGNIVADWDAKVEKKFALVDATDDSVELTDFSEMIDSMVDAQTIAVTSELTNTYKADLEQKNNEYRELSEKFETASEKLGAFEAEAAEKKLNDHRAEVNELFGSFAKKLGRNPKFLIYKAKCDVDHTDIDKIKQDLAIMLGENVVNSKNSFAYSPAESAVVIDKKESRYGNLLDKFE